MNIEEKRCECLYSIHLTQDRFQWEFIEHGNEISFSKNGRKFLAQLRMTLPQEVRDKV
jgi:hypothetical protein